MEDILILNENSILHMNLWVIDPKSYDDCNDFCFLLERNRRMKGTFGQY